MKKVMVFGVFDGMHEGHKAFLREAKKFGEHLIAVVAPNHIVEHLKGYLPEIDIAERMAHLEAEDGVGEVAVGDEKLSGWEVIKKYQPDVIALGYDQEALKADLEKNIHQLGYHPEIKVMSSFEPNIYHSSLLKK
ncbi:MAG: adenylyltransferase/cytidyltransferase family protein [Candidatus Harrisonbacteria bacterium]|nr:adenylyltransferase/cytidyltransferase family protein [Candidatus Harrisonbacteria bacterium]